MGNWWALRLAADGKGKGYDIPVFGGIHGDVPLDPSAGELVARLIVEQGISVVLDVSDFTEGEQHRFVTALSRQVFQLKKRQKSPLHMVFEEGHEFFPQFVDAAAAPLVGATKRLWKQGRNYGIGGTIVSQRPAEVNKGALWLTDRVVTGLLKADDDIKRVAGWANSNGVSDDMVPEIPRLPKGTMIAWEETGAVRTIFRKKKTFDASKDSDGNDVKAGKLTPVDIEAVRVAMAETIEKAKADDPKVLRARIAELEKESARGPKAAPAREPKVVEKPVLKEADLKRIEAVVRKVDRRFEQLVTESREGPLAIVKLMDPLAMLVSEARAALAPGSRFPPGLQQIAREVADPFVVRPRAAAATSSVIAQEGHEVVRNPSLRMAPNGAVMIMAPGEVKVLTAAAMYPGGVSRDQLSLFTGYKATARDTYVSRLNVKNMVTVGNGVVTATSVGIAALGPNWQPLPTGPALVEYWRQRLPPGERSILDIVLQHPDGITRNEIGEQANYKATARDTYVSRLHVRRLVRLERGAVFPSAELAQ